jgi:hypothetical protein
VVASAAGCLQNISREDTSRFMIQNCGGVPPLTELLFVEHLHTQACAAGALLNVSKLVKFANKTDFGTRFRC